MEQRKAAIIGAGVIGQGWAVTLLRYGWSVRLYDVEEQAAQVCLKEAEAAMRRVSVPDDAPPGNIQVVPDLKEALAGAEIALEAVPEKLGLKQQVLADIERHAASILPIASSTSSLLPTALARQMQHPERFVVAHPFNPSYLLPVVELVSGERTDPLVCDQVARLLESLGRRVVRVRCEIEGFIGNRLQAAVVNEAMNLVRLGAASPEDIDACISHGLALRWAFFGPFETMDMNARQGFREYASKFGNAYTELGKQLGVGESWRPADVLAIDAALHRGDAASPEDRLVRRDRALMALERVKRELELEPETR
jgi:3-hydroxyacyl-CoA dehydrogenase